jgi:phospholipid/cholesterol/gamma-HCH transport system substrate-binding protein
VKRLIALLALIAAGVGLAALRSSGRADPPSTAHFDVIFDDARGLVAGQLVKIAGAQAGTIDNVVVTPGFKARIEASVESRFMPLHRDATCTIRPQGLIAENYLACDPGTPGSPRLGGSPPTIPVSHTTEPVGLLDLFNTFDLSTRERLMVLLDELGVGTSGRGQDLNQIIRRANPTLETARQAISILTRQGRELQAVISATHTIMAQGAAHTGTLKRFLVAAAALSASVADHRGPLATAVHRLPGLIAATRPALQQVDTIARNGTPLLNQLRSAAPWLDRVSADLGPFAAAAGPALNRMAAALRKGTPALRESVPLTDAITAYTSRSKTNTLLTSRLYSNLQRHGFVENFYSVMYYIAASLARFDSTSHLLSTLLVTPQNGTCGQYATSPTPGCSAHYGSQPAYAPESARALSRLADYLTR